MDQLSHSIPDNVPDVFNIAIPDISKISQLTEWIQRYRYASNSTTLNTNQTISIDFSKTGIIRPYHITPLACLIHEYITHGHKIELQHTSPYLRSFNFKQFCDQETNANNFPVPNYPDTMPLWKIEEEACNIYPKQVQEYFERNRFYGKDLFGLGLSLGELMNNVFDHSECLIPGYTFTQYDTKKKLVITSICDFGVSIPEKVNRFLIQQGEQELSHVDAIKRAVEYKFSTKSQPRNRGFGLDSVINNVNALNGKLLIVSGHAVYWHYSKDHVETGTISSSFPGCQITIYLEADNLQSKELELSDDLQLI